MYLDALNEASNALLADFSDSCQPAVTLDGIQSQAWHA